MSLVSVPVDRCILPFSLPLSFSTSLLCVLATLKRAGNDHDNVFIFYFPRAAYYSRAVPALLIYFELFAIIARVILAARKKDRTRGGGGGEEEEKIDIELLSKGSCRDSRIATIEK